MWSEELQKMTIKHFGEAGATMLKAIVKGKYTFALGFDRNLFMTNGISFSTWMIRGSRPPSSRPTTSLRILSETAGRLTEIT